MMASVRMQLRTVPVVDRSALEKRSTRELLARLRKLLACEESLEASDLEPGEASLRADEIAFKDSAKWQGAYSEVKALLADREHVPGGDERKEKRHERARATRSMERKGR